MKHAERHPSLDVEGCFGCKVAGVSFGSNSTTTRGAVVAETNQRAKNWDKDMPAYKRLRQNGLQPRNIDGAAALEARAETAAQVEGRPDVEKLVSRGVAE
jgi:hypothetical protein